MHTDIDPHSLIGRKALDQDGVRIGTVDEVYLDDATGRPEWASVRTGLFGRDAFVPLTPSEFVDEQLRVPFRRALIREAPDFGVGRHLSPEQELQLAHHYGLHPASPRDAPPPGEEREFGTVAGSGTAGHRRDGDDAVGEAGVERAAGAGPEAAPRQPGNDPD